MHMILLFGALASFIANLAHWRARPQERWSYLPTAGWPKVLFNTLLLALPITAALSLMHLIPSIVFDVHIFAFAIWHQLYSILVRNAVRGKA